MIGSASLSESLPVADRARANGAMDDARNQRRIAFARTEKPESKMNVNAANWPSVNALGANQLNDDARFESWINGLSSTIAGGSSEEYNYTGEFHEDAVTSESARPGGLKAATAEQIADSLLRSMTLVSGLSRFAWRGPVHAAPRADQSAEGTAWQGTSPEDTADAIALDDLFESAMKPGEGSNPDGVPAIDQATLVPGAISLGPPVPASSDDLGSSGPLTSVVSTSQVPAPVEAAANKAASPPAMIREADSAVTTSESPGLKRGLNTEILSGTGADSGELAFAAILHERSAIADAEVTGEPTAHKSSPEVSSKEFSATSVKTTQSPSSSNLLGALENSRSKEDSADGGSTGNRKDSDGGKPRVFAPVAGAGEGARESVQSPQFSAMLHTAASHMTASSQRYQNTTEPTAEPASVAMAETAEITAAPKTVMLREMVFRVGDPASGTVDLAVVRRQGGLHVAVRTEDGALQGALRDRLPELVKSLDRSGFHAETYVPGGMDPPLSGPAADQQRIDSKQETGEDSQNRQSSGRQNPNQRNSREQSHEQWRNQMENTLQ